MDTLIVIGAVALLLAMLLTASTPAPQPPVIVVMQPAPDVARGGGCLGLIIGVILFAGLVLMVAQAAS